MPGLTYTAGSKDTEQSDFAYFGCGRDLLAIG